ncbi:MAG: alpha/beta fold hydrolase [Candidatus Electrothrix sp. YB6]
MQKRRILGTITVLALAAAFILTPVTDVSAESDKKTFVLVHGAFGDQAVWDGPDADKGVAEKLRERGYRVVTLTLPGLGRNNAQASESIDLAAHVQYVADVLEIDNITDAVMVCHSYAGMVCAALQDVETGGLLEPREEPATYKKPWERIDKMVFFDAAVPLAEDKTEPDAFPPQSFFSAIGMPSPGDFPDLETYYAVLHEAAGFPIPSENLWCFPNLPAAAFGLTDPEEIAWLDARQHCQPIHTLDQPLTFNWNDEVKKYYVHATDDWFSFEAFSHFGDRAEEMGWNMYTISGSHYVAISKPNAVAKLLTLIDYIPYTAWNAWGAWLFH